MDGKGSEMMEDAYVVYDEVNERLTTTAAVYWTYAGVKSDLHVNVM